MENDARSHLTVEGCVDEEGGHAPPGGISSVTSATVLLSSMSLGVGVFTLPTVVNTVGWLWGFALIFIFGLVSMLLMLNILDVSCQSKCKTWEEVASFSPFGRQISNVALFLSYLIGNAAHMQTVSGILFDLMSRFVTGDYGQTEFNIAHRVIIYAAFFLFAAPYCFMDDLGALRHVGKAIAVVVVLTCAIIVVETFFKAATGHGAQGDDASPAALPNSDFKALLSTAPNVCFAFTGMLCLWEVLVATKQGVGERAPVLMRKAVWCSALLVLSVYLLVTLGAVLAFGRQAGEVKKGSGHGNVLYNFPPSDVAVTTMSLAIVIVIVLEYPIINFPLVNMVLRVRRLKLSRFRFARHALSIFFMLLVALLDCTVPDLPDVFGLCGSLGLSISCYLLPGLVLLGFGGSPFRMVLGVVAILLGLVMLFGGTFFILQRVITGKQD